MTTLLASEARARLYKLLDEAAASHEPIQITGKRNNAVLVITDQTLNNLPGGVAVKDKSINLLQIVLFYSTIQHFPTKRMFLAGAQMVHNSDDGWFMSLLQAAVYQE